MTEDASRRLSIRDVAAQTGVSAHTLRYYERIGLLGPVARVAGRRCYAPGDVEWVRLLSCLRETGMGIRDMLRFVVAGGDEADVARQRLAMLEAHRDAVVARQQAVAESLRVIEWKLGRYREAVAGAAIPHGDDR
jgi:DNA-binding transcriptional MerR regulator